MRERTPAVLRCERLFAERKRSRPRGHGWLSWLFGQMVGSNLVESADKCVSEENIRTCRIGTATADAS
jgi:hypothetical protein